MFQLFNYELLTSLMQLRIFVRLSMNECLYSTFPLLQCTAVDGGWEMGLRVSASSRVSIYSLWDYAGVHCNKGNVLYRHSFIDNLTNIRSCINDVSNS
jgi:hypothetical protein